MQREVKTLDVKMQDLKENPNDLELLYDVMAMVHLQAEELAARGQTIPGLDVVNYVLAAALKADQIAPSQLGLVLCYLETVNAPPIYYQYAILRVHQNLQDCRLLDIASSIENVHALGEDEKIEKVLSRVENYLEVTDEKKLLGEGPNLGGLLSLYRCFAGFECGSWTFWEKLEKMVAAELRAKEHELPLDELMAQLVALSLKRCRNQEIWEPLLSDLEKIIGRGGFNMLNVYHLLRSLSAVDLLEEDLTRGMVNYLVKKGYDSDDLLELSSKKGGYRRAVHLIWIISESAPDLKNKHFMTHVEQFVQHAFKSMSSLQQLRLYTALSKLQHFKNAKLMNQLRKATFGKQLDELEQKPDNESQEADVQFNASDDGYFTFEESDQEDFGFGQGDDNEFDIEDDFTDDRKYSQMK